MLKIYSFASSAAFPDEWLKEKTEMFNPDLNEESDFGKTIWGKIILNEIKDAATEAKNNFQSALKITRKFEELTMYTVILEESLSNLRSFYNKLNNSWDEAFEFYNSNEIFGKWTTNNKITLDEKKMAKDLRDKGIKILNDTVKKYFMLDSKSIFRDIH